jgi:hypothetical protein
MIDFIALIAVYAIGGRLLWEAYKMWREEINES